ncbi:MAG: hypothetical protein A3B91_03255 [Candidatus Yanofskybacteria bacterium RIFCSPHIGHO2_02_FULL_41_29]|uniref:Uncharacterized protein n=1 Tax=Candidatus Yanofskybacteria bacterium RIFCSPHIGHO2_01_FULL_41_53 TaxID=1802663 RepID=A0A1F8EH72_9BACT|nr:MAG: hypothetical protein A2650_01080 [Candidatus Yanofskybacteria bacterium RIFCSPHIGHO2_01_FULL_41_53]OGN10681.1 MAG: hypothetical protein A3B91_03255 [Candidatus Yanofskybacteria bacterium RIFCSPHIGHO2_02_FULL_41_29]OGN18129.1 MAG: hypothetical protein A3F48_02270 [Candidatus Yanofskybacteria bacterium RIFCSPHIGHO2_12_FULL_41_9]OGN24061.1 MAG: hypothetical protein A2916_04875 [Candidatus Yanofskybacteria bacterium RIFCSPLOWO2_01_FULL_41_67]OGN30480.1 MAG: hypothetical protein A3H54_00425 
MYIKKMGKFSSIFGSKVSVLFVVVVSAFLFLLFSNSVSAAGSGLDTADYIYFRIDTEINVLNGKGVIVQWSCGGGATSGSYNTKQGYITDGTASDSDGLQDGIIKVASASAENTGTNGSGCDVNETTIATVSLNGWLTRTWTSVTITNTEDFTTRASMDYDIVVNGTTDEFGTTLTLNGTTASATYSGTVASQSYSNYSGSWKKYIAGSTFSGTVTGGADGYVNRTSSDLTISATASQSIDFGTTDDSSLDESGLLFGHKVQVFQQGGTFDNSKVTSGTVLAGDSYGTTCTIGTGSVAGYWYCPVPLANTGTLARYSGGALQTTTGAYTDRSVGSDSQNSAVINPAGYSSGGGGGGSSYTPASTPVSTLTLTPEPSPSPTPVPISMPTPASHGFVTLAALSLHEGDVISAASSDDPDVYIVNDWGYKRLFLNPVIFGFYGHLGGFTNVKNTQSSTRDTLVTSGLFRNCEADDQRVFGVETTGEDTGIFHWVNTSGSQAVADDPDFFKKVFCINSNEFGWYAKGSDYTSVNQVPSYSR